MKERNGERESMISLIASSLTITAITRRCRTILVIVTDPFSRRTLSRIEAEGVSIAEGKYRIDACLPSNPRIRSEWTNPLHARSWRDVYRWQPSRVERDKEASAFVSRGTKDG